jgi:DNA-binding FrmR family transcriptional regulator
VYGYGNNQDAILKRLRQIEGQVRGLARMVESDAYCIDILTQVSAATRALQTVARELLDDHLRHCVADMITHGSREGEDKLAEVSATITRLLKS